MIRSVLALFSILLVFSASAVDGDTIKVQSHDETHWSWYGNYFDTVQFPASGDYRKVIMHYTLGCPDQGCSEWDYTTRIDIGEPINDSTMQWVELVRIITPYAGDKGADWKHTWAIDVSDYVSLLNGDRVIRAQYSGYQDGFTVSIDFDMIEGTPPRDVVGFDQIYHGSFPYGYQNDPIEDYLVPTDVAMSSTTSAAKVRMVASGHGFNGSGPDPGNPDNCAEFCDKYFRVLVDNNQINETVVWRDDCGSNILEDQTGTWIYNRAGWCPGDVANRYDTDISSLISAGQTHNINVDWEPYTYTSGSSFGISYFIATQVVQYGDWNHETDLSLERILQPSNDDRAMNINPICGDGLVQLKNEGSRSITSFKLDYWVEGGIERKQVSWSGILSPGEAEMVALPMEDFKLYGGMTDNIFHVEVAEVNAGFDDYDANDHVQAYFELPPALPASIIIITNNNNVAETRYRIEDMNGTEVFAVNDLAGGATQQDTVDLTPGCYTMFVEDVGCDGLSFFANSDGNGRIRIHPNEQNIFPWLFEFESGFGCETQYSFSVDNALSTAEVVKDESMTVYPNPSNGRLNVSLNVEQLEGSVELIDLTGRVIRSKAADERLITFETVPAGHYLVRYTAGTKVMTERAVVTR